MKEGNTANLKNERGRKEKGKEQKQRGRETMLRSNEEAAVTKAAVERRGMRTQHTGCGRGQSDLDAGWASSCATPFS